jgi:hypothetical protein
VNPERSPGLKAEESKGSLFTGTGKNPLLDGLIIGKKKLRGKVKILFREIY